MENQDIFKWLTGLFAAMAAWLWKTVIGNGKDIAVLKESQKHMKETLDAVKKQGDHISERQDKILDMLVDKTNV